ncbi:MAG: hypothetical protein K9H48_07675 [Melioribacteraceae bacterium]|nr:hypothetical protein [Melioribacteraceae bacterium]
MTTYHVETIKKYEEKSEINGKWVLARPINYKYRNLKQKIIEAWKVFTGELDSLMWDHQ